MKAIAYEKFDEKNNMCFFFSIKNGDFPVCEPEVLFLNWSGWALMIPNPNKDLSGQSLRLNIINYDCFTWIYIYIYPNLSNIFLIIYVISGLYMIEQY